MENVDSIHPASSAIQTDSQRCVGIYRLSHIYYKEEKSAEKHFVMFSIWSTWAVETQNYNIKAFFCFVLGFFFVVVVLFCFVFLLVGSFLCYLFAIMFFENLTSLWDVPPLPFPISRKYAHIWIMTFLQELTAVCANHAYKSITKAYVL